LVGEPKSVCAYRPTERQPETSRKTHIREEPVIATQPELDSRTFKQIVALIYDRAGILLSDQKETLVATRLGKPDC
jgi:hypothetical protein